MGLLKRVLYAQAAVWALVGVALAVVPGFVLESLFSQFPSSDYAWVRIVGVQMLGAALLSVLIGQSIEDRWWWSWAFAIANAGVATIAVATAAFGTRIPTATLTRIPANSNLLVTRPTSGELRGSSPELWWLIAATEAVLTGLLLWGMAKAGTEQPPDLRPPDD